MSSPELLASEMPPEQRVTELHAWIATHANGGEGIVAAMLPGLGAVPLVSSKRELMASEQASAAAFRAMALSAGRGDEEVVSIRLVTFRQVADG